MAATKARALVGAAASTVVLVLTSVAWACTGSPQYFTSRPQAAPAGTAVSVSGSGFRETGAAARGVEIRWNSTSGRLLATAAGPAFTVSVTVPDVAPRTYTIVAVQRESDGSIAMTASTAFAVTERSSSTAPSPSRDSSKWQTAPAEQPAAQPAPAPAPARASSRPAAQPASAARSTSPAQRRAALRPVTRTPVPAQAAAPQAAAPELAPASPPAAEVVSPSRATASGDVWSAFETSGALRGPSLASPAVARPRDSSAAVVGAALLAVGAAAALGAFVVLASRRRRATAGTGRD